MNNLAIVEYDDRTYFSKICEKHCLNIKKEEVLLLDSIIPYFTRSL